MKKSAIYYTAQIAVVCDDTMLAQDKLEVLRELMVQEDLETFREERNGKDVG